MFLVLVAAGISTFRSSTIQISGTCENRPCSSSFGDNEKIPVWMYVENDGHTPLSPQMVALHVALLKKNAPSDRFVIHIFNRSEATKFVDLPQEWPRCGNAGACFSDVVRTAIMAQRGGIYIDADVMVNKPLTQIADDLKKFDIVSYASPGQKCTRGIFSSNFLATRPSVIAYKRAFELIKTKMKRACYKGDTPVECNIGWAEFGEGTSHPITRELAAQEKLAMKCYSGLESFTPHGNGREYNIFHIYRARFNDTCHAKGADLFCDDGVVVNFYNRLAYHTFNSIH